MATKDDLPRYGELMLPTLMAVQSLGGSAKSRQITEAAIEALGVSDELLAITYPGGRGKSIFIDRLDWARSYCKLGGALESPRRGLFLLTPLGREIVALDWTAARLRLEELDREVRSTRRSKSSPDPSDEEHEAPDDSGEEASSWRTDLLLRLHSLSPTAFELFALYLLRTYDLELEHVGGVGDLGIDGIGVAPLSPVLSATVAVQAKRYDPAATIGREKVALFQRDAAAAGAERAIMVTLGRYSPAARKVSQSSTPTIDLIDGDRLCDLVLEQQIGIRVVPEVVPEFFDTFEPGARP